MENIVFNDHLWCNQYLLFLSLKHKSNVKAWAFIQNLLQLQKI